MLLKPVPVTFGLTGKLTIQRLKMYNGHLSGHGHKFEPYPWILLNLCLSCFAALQCLILLVANKRGEQIAAEIDQHTHDNTESDTKLLVANTEPTRQVKTHADLLEEIHLHVANIGKKVGAETGRFAPGDTSGA